MNCLACKHRRSTGDIYTDSQCFEPSIATAFNAGLKNKKSRMFKNLVKSIEFDSLSNLVADGHIILIETENVIFPVMFPAAWIKSCGFFESDSKKVEEWKKMEVQQ